MSPSQLAANGSVAEEASESTFVAAVQGPQDENAKVLLCINLASTYFSLNNFTEVRFFFPRRACGRLLRATEL